MISVPRGRERHVLVSHGEGQRVNLVRADVFLNDRDLPGHVPHHSVRFQWGQPSLDTGVEFGNPPKPKLLLGLPIAIPATWR